MHCNLQTRSSKTVFTIYMNILLVNWYSKKQSTIETLVFGTEFVSMKFRVDTLHATRYKLRMMGIPISGPTYIQGDNMLVFHNTSKPESTLKKKFNAIASHAIHKSVAMIGSLRGHFRSDDNPADLLTNAITG